MRLHPDLHRATFVSRPNRFAALMRSGGREVLVHVANSGRMRELFLYENPMFLAPAEPEALAKRKTAFDLALVETDGVLVSADARLPNTLLREAIEADLLPAFGGYDEVRPEVRFEDSRLDIVLSGQPGLCYIETKSVTLVEGGVGLFPDAPTDRGRKHVLTLREAVRQGHRAAVVFVVQRSDADSMAPNEAADPKFCLALRNAVAEGVEVYAHRCSVSLSSIELGDAITVRLD